MELNRITTNIRQEAFDLSPEFQRKLELSDEVNWTFAILFGQHLHLQVPLACDADGVLSVDEPALVSSSDELGIADYFDNLLMSPPLYSCNDAYALAEYFDSVSGYAPLYDSTDSTPLADIMDGILAILTDVYDSENSWIKVYQSPA